MSIKSNGSTDDFPPFPMTLTTTALTDAAQGSLASPHDWRHRVVRPHRCYSMTHSVLAVCLLGTPTTILTKGDNARTHGKRMEIRAHELLNEIAQHVVLPEFSLSFWHIPSYSPQLNPAEYLIHEVRRKGFITCPVHYHYRKRLCVFRIN